MCLRTKRRTGALALGGSIQKTLLPEKRAHYSSFTTKFGLGVENKSRNLFLLEIDLDKKKLETLSTLRAISPFIRSEHPTKRCIRVMVTIRT